MTIIKGEFSSAKIFTADTIDSYALTQLRQLCSLPALSGTRIRVMPDVHPGKVGTIGLTMTLGNKIMPNLTGIDIGCGITLAKIIKGRTEWKRLDSVIRENIPSGCHIRKTAHIKSSDFDFSHLHCFKHINENTARLSLGTLGSGNHFIEIDRDDENGLYTAVHSGSRHLGKEVTEYYLSEGYKALKAQGSSLPYELTYLEGRLMEEYLHDVQILTEYAALNRQIILYEIIKGMKWKAAELYSCPHNYIAADSETTAACGAPVLRKGAVSALEGETVIIPANMRDGIILGTGLGNKEWNCSAPHGSGRIIKRCEVRNSCSVSKYRAAMKGIYSPSINSDTLDEAPFAYRSLDEIKAAVSGAVKTDKILKPVYNFKAGSK